MYIMDGRTEIKIKCDLLKNSTMQASLKSIVMCVRNKALCTCGSVMAVAIVYDVNVSMTPTVRSKPYILCIAPQVVDKGDLDLTHVGYEAQHVFGIPPHCLLCKNSCKF